MVSRLFNIVEPQIAVFGLKDYQQYLVIEKMVQDLLFDIEIVGVEIIREANGLAMSSRNNYLSDEQRQVASQLYNTLQNTAQSISAGNKDNPALESKALELLEKAGMQPDYFAICDAAILQAPGRDTARLAILAAAYLGRHAPDRQCTPASSLISDKRCAPS